MCMVLDTLFNLIITIISIAPQAIDMPARVILSTPQEPNWHIYFF